MSMSTKIYFILNIFPEKKIPPLETHVMYLNCEGEEYAYILL